MPRRKLDPHQYQAEKKIKRIHQESKELFRYNDREHPPYYYTVARLCYTLASLKTITDFKRHYTQEVQLLLVKRQIKQYLNGPLPSPADHLISPTLEREYQLKLSILTELTQTPQGLRDAFIITKDLINPIIYHYPYYY